LALDLRTNDFGRQFCMKRGLPRVLKPEGRGTGATRQGGR
jgi:hypothetical protein